MNTIIDKTLESRFKDFSDLLNNRLDVKRVKYHIEKGEYILFQFSMDDLGVFFTDSFYFDSNTDFNNLDYQIDFYLKHGTLP